jgi:hypothetical protein
MTQTTVPPVRARVRALAFVVAVIAGVSIAVACAETRRALGDQCIKSEDCLSGLCSDFECTATYPTTNSEDNAETGAVETGPTPEASPEAAPEASGDDSSGGSEGGDAPSEAASGD